MMSNLLKCNFYHKGIMIKITDMEKNNQIVNFGLFIVNQKLARIEKNRDGLKHLQFRLEQKITS